MHLTQYSHYTHMQLTSDSHMHACPHHLLVDLVIPKIMCSYECYTCVLWVNAPDGPQIHTYIGITQKLLYVCEVVLWSSTYVLGNPNVLHNCYFHWVE